MVWFSKPPCSDRGAPRRAFFSSIERPLRLALLCSAVLHIALLWPLRMHPIKLPPPRDMTLQVSIEWASTEQGERTAMPFPPREIDAPPVPLPDRHTVVAEPAKADEPRAEASPPEPPGTAPPPPADAPAAATGLALPQSLPIPFPGNRPLWSFQGPAMANAQAAYQAQRQHQMQLAMQAQLQFARGQFAAHLMAGLDESQVHDRCQLVLPSDGTVRLHCQQDADANAVRALLDRLGTPPPLPAGRSWLVIELAPGPADGRTLVSSQSSELDPGP